MEQNGRTEEQLLLARSYQQEMLDESLKRNIIIALDTGSGKTHIAVLRMKIEAEREIRKISWFIAPTVALCEQQRDVISASLPVSVGFISGALEPNQWKDASLWKDAISTHRIMVSTPQVLLDALRHGYVNLGIDIGLLVFDEAHHAADRHPYNMIMREFYDACPPRVIRPVADVVDVRPFVLGLTASPIFGGNVEKAFNIIEKNLDSTIRTPIRSRAELAQFVHRPAFKHVLYPQVVYTPGTSASGNVNALASVLRSLNIEDDPYVAFLRSKLLKTPKNSVEYHRVDQKLSKTINKEDTYTHKGLRDFHRAADEICYDLGVWAADWFVEKVLHQATKNDNPYRAVISDWQSKEKAYLLTILNRVNIQRVSYTPGAVRSGTSAKAKALISCLLSEKAEWDSHNEIYSGLIFVTRRDAVLALSELLIYHPDSAGHFIIGCLLGGTEGSRGHSFLDITRSLLRQSQSETLSDFRIGEKNLIVSTSVAEEGIDIQACGSVIRWDPPQNMVSWAQSRGRARKSRSSFVLMFEDDGVHAQLVEQWERLEADMIRSYMEDDRAMRIEDAVEDANEDEDGYIEFRVGETGALLTLNSAVSHLFYFCSVLPNSSHAEHVPIFDIYPPDYPEGYHSSPLGRMHLQPYTGPFGARVTLPKQIPPDQRVYTTEIIYPTKRSAYRHVAFQAYVALYKAGLLNENLLPLMSFVEPDLEEDVKKLLRDVEKRDGLADVTEQMNPWDPDLLDDSNDCWWVTKILIDGLCTVTMLSRVNVPIFEVPEILFDPAYGRRSFRVESHGLYSGSSEDLNRAKEYTRILFYIIHDRRMTWDRLDFAYLFLPVAEQTGTIWDERRRRTEALTQPPQGRLLINAMMFAEHFSYAEDLYIVMDHRHHYYKFLGWQKEPLPQEEHEFVVQRYSRFADAKVSYPLIIVQAISTRMNFLIPSETHTEQNPTASYLLPSFTSVVLGTALEVQLSILLPTILRVLSVALTTHSLRTSIFGSTQLNSLPLDQLKVAIAAPVASEMFNYQRLETLGDTVLKFIIGLQLLSQYPLWHEGYLTRRKDHIVSNASLARAAIRQHLYRWIMRNRFNPRKWKPEYHDSRMQSRSSRDVGEGEDNDLDAEDMQMPMAAKPLSQLSTKTLADVVESLIGVAYLNGGFEQSIECIRVFNLGVNLEPIPNRVDAILARTEELEDVPAQLSVVEQMLEYDFKKKVFLVEALMHASCQNDLRTVSYERMEFLGDSVLDMIVSELLYHAPGKNYSPGQLHARRSALVNGHFLGFMCLRSSVEVEAKMPKVDGPGQATVMCNHQKIYLWQCLLHSSSSILDDQTRTFDRFQRGQKEIEYALHHAKIYPWAALTRLQAPKFFSDIIESLVGAVYIDSGGSMDKVRGVLEKIGILPVLRHIVNNDVDVEHPVSRIASWAAKKHVEIEYRLEQKGGNITCSLLSGDEVVAEITERYRGKASQEEVRLRVAEMGSKILSKRVFEPDDKP